MITLGNEMANLERDHRRDELRRSLRKPHADSVVIAEQGFDDWAGSLPDEDTEALVSGSGNSVRWVPGEGWVEGRAN
jgi:hypothetical protein